MRMTRAALRAQEAEEELQVQIEGKLREQGLYSQTTSSNSAEPLIHEDNEEHVSDESHTLKHDNEDYRPALRDITGENYPTTNPESIVLCDEVEQDSKSTKRAKSKRGKKGTVKKTEHVVEAEQPETETVIVDEQLTGSLQAESDGTPSKEELANTSSLEPASETSHAESIGDSQPDVTPEMSSELLEGHSEEQVVDDAISHEADVSEIMEQQHAPETPRRSTETISKTPKFNPDIHLPATPSSETQADTTEDSFIDSIKTRSPSKFTQSLLDSENQETIASIHQIISCSPPRAVNHVPSPGSQRIEDSVDAMDDLEDAIEKFAEDLPLIEALPFESPMRSRKTPARTPAKATAPIAARFSIQTPGKAAASVSAKTPAKTPAQVSSKTPARTPARTAAKTPAKASTRTSAKELEKNATPDAKRLSTGKKEAKTPQSLREMMASAKRETVKDRIKAIESGPTPAPHRRATSVHVLKKEAPEVRPTLKSKHAATKSVSALTSAAVPSMSFSNSPVKQDPNQQKKRVTSGGVLSTSKPGFVPAKSSKPATTSTFALPGEAVAAKLKAQREERLKKEEPEPEKKPAFKARPVPTRTVRPSVMPRENKASAARLSVRQASGENKENVAPIRSSSSSTTVPSKSVASTTSKPSATTATANSSVRRTTIAPKPATTVESKKGSATTSKISAQASERISSLTSGQQITMTKAEAAQQKLKGKEVYDRIRSTVQQQEEERKVKEEAARKARAEAAERGRQASREWAEKQKKKLASSVKPAAAVAST